MPSKWERVREGEGRGLGEVEGGGLRGGGGHRVGGCGRLVNKALKPHVLLQLCYWGGGGAAPGRGGGGRAGHQVSRLLQLCHCSDGITAQRVVKHQDAQEAHLSDVVADISQGNLGNVLAVLHNYFASHNPHGPVPHGIP